MRIWLLLLGVCASGAFRSMHVRPAQSSITSSTSRTSKVVLQTLQRAPPTPPAQFAGGGGGGDGDGLVLRTLDQQHIVTVLSLWMWQLSAAGSCDEVERVQMKASMESMMAWGSEPSSSWLASDVLKPRTF
eukprot:2354266-Prymnesium_polylepis.2